MSNPGQDRGTEHPPLFSVPQDNLPTAEPIHPNLRSSGTSDSMTARERYLLNPVPIQNMNFNHLYDIRGYDRARTFPSSPPPSVHGYPCQFPVLTTTPTYHHNYPATAQYQGGASSSSSAHYNQHYRGEGVAQCTTFSQYPTGTGTPRSSHTRFDYSTVGQALTRSKDYYDDFDWESWDKSDHPKLEYSNIQDRIGIPWSSNSCYMDSALMSLFMYHNKFANHLPAEIPEGINENKVLQILRTGILEPLYSQKRLSEGSTAMMEFRKALAKFEKSYRSEQKDPEDFMTTLFEDILKCSPFYRIEGSTEGGFVYQTFGPSSTNEIDVQTLLDFSFEQSGILLDDMPNPGLVLKLPVTNGRHTYTKITPNLTISLKKVLKKRFTDLLGRHEEMMLTAVICLKSNHFTSFIRTSKIGWIYVDSLDRTQYSLISNLNEFLQPEGAKKYSGNNQLLKLLFRNPYICVYIPNK